MSRLLLILAWALVGLVAAANSFAAAADLPQGSNLYRLQLTRYAIAQFGPTAPVALLAAQVHQESAWRANASSGVAHGLTHFTMYTAKWIPTICPGLAPVDVWSADWSLRAQACYMHHLKSTAAAETECDSWAFALADYNGGRGWRLKEAALAAKAGANPRRWFGHVALFRVRGVPAFNESRGYPQRILLTLLPRYISAGFAGRVLC